MRHDAIACCLALSLVGCGSSPADAPSATARAAEPRPEPELSIGADHVVDESLSDGLSLPYPALDRFTLTHRGDVGDGTEEVRRCTGAFPAEAAAALRRALEAHPFVEGEGVTASLPGPHHATRWWVSLTEYPSGEHGSRTSAPPSVEETEALAPALGAALEAARGVEAECTSAME